MSTTIRQCLGASDHRPQYLEVDRHHTYPTGFCDLLGVAKRNETVDLCIGCHDRVHHSLRHLVNEGSTPHRLSDGERYLVDAAWVWWQNVLLSQTP